MTISSGGSSALNNMASAKLTAREASIICLLACGLTNWEIAKRLMISHHTVAQHVTRMLYLWEARSRCELVARAYAVGVLMPGVWPPQYANE